MPSARHFLKLFESVYLSNEEMQILLRAPAEGDIQKGWAILEVNDCPPAVAHVWSRVAGVPLNSIGELSNTVPGIGNLNGQTFAVYAHRGMHDNGNWEAYLLVKTIELDPEQADMVLRKAPVPEWHGVVDFDDEEPAAGDDEMTYTT